MLSGSIPPSARSICIIFFRNVFCGRSTASESVLSNVKSKTYKYMKKIACCKSSELFTNTA